MRTAGRGAGKASGGFSGWLQSGAGEQAPGLQRREAYLAPELPENLKGIRFLRSGLLLGEFKKGRFEPSQPFAMALSPKNFRRYISWEPDDERVEKYLRGESVPVDLQREKAENGWNLVCVGNFSLGWGKISNGLLKNKYLCGWRKS